MEIKEVLQVTINQKGKKGRLENFHQKGTSSLDNFMFSFIIFIYK